MRLRTPYFGELQNAPKVNHRVYEDKSYEFSFVEVPTLPFKIMREVLESGNPFAQWFRSVCEYVGEPVDLNPEWEIWRAK